ncbi:uncharacterized protein A1O5_11027 [Cladophialophora psammophila CBS 110553]|uniref:Heterokaryon incompatibility domain-containing protein n=1 Tax=Cladophialophora psammophila CBS 110553 TaxID=1182543 RepID=W9WMB9_9EURO|nr:uncharacterized protein A1O5_11027 [Cladophialophora psammophila CBS 110553]EXJ65786.1 hypothetical protein A1O5_11027 [Cladophialophora psammophila CBS 110553]
MKSNKKERTEAEIGRLTANCETPSVEGNWNVAAALWNEAEDLGSKDMTKRGFRPFLSTAQFYSFLMLREWLHSEYEIEGTVQEIYHWLYIDGPGIVAFEGQSARDSHLASEEVRHRTLYQKLMADLVPRRIFFCSLGRSGREFETSLQRDALSQPGRDPATSVAGENGAAHFVEVHISQLEPRIGQLRRMLRSRESNSKNGLLSVAESVTHLARDFQGISGTSSRTNRGPESISVPGIAWQLPLNYRFDVAGLLDVFLGLKGRFSTAYIWFDLFCIPQQADDRAFASIISEEIAKQAVIFQDATACLAWLNYIDDRIGEYSTLGWLSAQYAVLSSQPGMCEAKSLMKAAKRGRNLPLQLTRLSAPTFRYPPWKRRLIEAMERLHGWWMNRRGYIVSYYHFEPSDWFSGVWTLLEAYLRPNMAFANKDWNILCDAGGETMSLEELFAFNDIVWDMRSHDTQILGSFLIKGHGVEDSPIHPFMRIHVRDSLENECPLNRAN